MVLAWVSRSPGVSWGEDDATYVVLGRELLQGSYAERWNVDAPIHARYPPGFPALLSIANVLFGDHVTVYMVPVLLASAASVGLFFIVVHRHFGDAVALVVTGQTAINTMAVSDAGLVMTEAPFRLQTAVASIIDEQEMAGTSRVLVRTGQDWTTCLTRLRQVGAYSAVERPVNRWTMDLSAPTTRRQNMRMNPATAAKTEARGISVSGPIYNVMLSVDV